MNEKNNKLVGTIYSKKHEEREKALRQLTDMKKREKHTYLRYVLKFGTAEIHTNKPEMWLEQGAVIIREVTPTGEEKRRRGRPKKK